MTEISLKEMKDILDDNVLDLSARNLETVPKALVQLPKATNIDLSRNRLVSIPPELCNMSRIVELDLGSNQLVVLPDNFGSLVNLQHLNLHNNEIEELPLSFANLRSLKWLDLSRNNLVFSLQNEIGNCSNDKECKQAAINAVSFMKKVQENIQKAKAKQDKVNQKIQAASEAQRAQAKKNNQSKKNKKHQVEGNPDELEAMTKHHKEKKEKNHSNEKDEPHKPAEKLSRGCFGLLFSLVRFFVRWSVLIALCFVVCATIALSYGCYSNGGSHIPNSKSFCTDLTKLTKFKAPSDKFVQHAKNAYGSVFNGYKKQISIATDSAHNAVNKYYNTSNFTRDVQKFFYKCYERLTHYAFFIFTLGSDVYQDLMKWYDNQGKKNIGFIVEPLKVGFQMVYEIGKDLFWAAANLLQVVIGRLALFLERVFNVWAQKGFGQAVDEAFKH